MPVVRETKSLTQQSRALRRVYLVTHVHELPSGGEDVKVIGIYGSEKDAKQAVERSKAAPGFRDHLDGFSVQAYDIGKDHWSEGFITLMPNEM